MTHIFYLFILLFLVYELFFLINLKEYLNAMLDLKRYLKNEGQYISYKNFPEHKKSTFYRCLFALFLVLFLFIGLLSSQWFLFASYLLVAFIIFQPLISITRKIKPLYYSLAFIDTLVAIIFSLLVILNKYHLHIDFYSYFKTLFL